MQGDWTGPSSRQFSKMNKNEFNQLLAERMAKDLTNDILEMSFVEGESLTGMDNLGTIQSSPVVQSNEIQHSNFDFDAYDVESVGRVQNPSSSQSQETAEVM